MADTYKERDDKDYREVLGTLHGMILVRDEYIGELWGMLHYLYQRHFGLLDDALDDEMLEKLDKMLRKNMK